MSKEQSEKRNKKWKLYHITSKDTDFKR